MTLNDPESRFQGHAINAEYVRNGTRYRNNYNEILIETYALLKTVILNDLE